MYVRSSSSLKPSTDLLVFDTQNGGRLVVDAAIIIPAGKADSMLNSRYRRVYYVRNNIVGVCTPGWNEKGTNQPQRQISLMVEI